MLGWILLGVVVFIIVLLIILKILNRKPSYEVTRMSSGLENKSFWDKVKDACCIRKR